MGRGWRLDAGILRPHPRLQEGRKGGILLSLVHQKEGEDKLRLVMNGKYHLCSAVSTVLMQMQIFDYGFEYWS